MKRIFVAIELSDEARARADAHVQNLRNDFRELRVGWEKKEKLHLTLKFLGEIGDKQIAALIQAAEYVASAVPPFRLQLGRCRHFGKRILWLGVSDKSGNLAKFHKLLERECDKTDLPGETKRFNPHLTIARVREPNKSSALVKKHLEYDFVPVEFVVSEIVIYESMLGSAGSTYIKVKAIDLTGSSA
jgi:2'-5' RNA ligase